MWLTTWWPSSTPWPGKESCHKGRPPHLGSTWERGGALASAPGFHATASSRHPRLLQRRRLLSCGQLNRLWTTRSRGRLSGRCCRCPAVAWFEGPEANPEPHRAATAGRLRGLTSERGWTSAATPTQTLPRASGVAASARQPGPAERRPLSSTRPTFSTRQDFPHHPDPDPPHASGDPTSNSPTRPHRGGNHWSSAWYVANFRRSGAGKGVPGALATTSCFAAGAVHWPPAPGFHATPSSRHPRLLQHRPLPNCGQLNRLWTTHSSRKAQSVPCRSVVRGGRRPATTCAA